MRAPTLVLVLLLATLSVACRKTSDGYEIDPDAEASAREAAERVEEEAKDAGRRLEKGAERAAETLAEQGEVAAGKIETAAEDLGERLQDQAREAAARAQPIIERKVDDATITARVKAKLLADPEVRTFSIDVDTVDGVVTLGGAVENEAAHLEALKHARQTEGVRQVVDRVVVGASTQRR